MEGRMQQWPLVVTSFLEYAAKWHAEQEIICKTVEGTTVISTYTDLNRRSQLCALMLQHLGIRHGHVVATLAWNTTRHMETWYGIMGIGAICHTLNPRLSDTDIGYIANHGGARIILADAPYLPLLARILPQLPSVQAVVLLTDGQHMPSTPSLSVPVLCYEQLLDAQVSGLPFVWPTLDENAPCGLCYTSGTTGNPKGVLYTHRSNYLHSMTVGMPDSVSLSSGDTMLMVVPMFHANSWGIVFAGPMLGARLVLPGPHLDGESIYHLLESQQVTASAGVPTVWLNLLAHMELHKLRFSSLRRVVIGGAAPARTMIEQLEGLGVEVRHMWGMTELSPLGTVAGIKGALLREPIAKDELMHLKTSQGRPHIFCDMRLMDDAGNQLPHDGVAVGNLQVRGPIVTAQYHRHEGRTLTADGWFDTGDVATIDRLGYMRITDRSKDVVKSGGEWISSIQLENAAMGHPGVAEAAVVALPDAKWGERPLLVVVAKHPSSAGERLRLELLDFMAKHVAKFAVPDDVVFVDEIPHNATGKVSKLALRAMFKDYKPRVSKL